jgi:hypothetical protein
MPKTPRPDKLRSRRLSRVRTLGEILSKSPPRNDAQLAVAQGAQALDAARAWVVGLLPAALGEHVTQALERDGDLTVFTESSAWAARLKLALAERREALAPRLSPDARITVRVVPGGRYRR